MLNRKSSFHFVLSVIAALGVIATSSIGAAQSADRPRMNSNLSPEERADLVLKQLTLDEKLALLHGNGMAHAAQWQMPLSHLTDGGAGYVIPIHVAGGTVPNQGASVRLVHRDKFTCLSRSSTEKLF